MPRKIIRLCKCGCGEITNCGRKFINYHFWRNKEYSAKARKRLSLANKGKKHSEETKLKMSLAQIGNKKGEGNRGRKVSEETKLKMSLAKIKYNPNYEYCDIWKDKEYKDGLRKDYCENTNCKGNYRKLNNHHIYLDKKQCAPNDIITLCASCHLSLHNRLRRRYRNKIPNSEDYMVIDRSDHVSYIHKKSKRVIRTDKR